MSTNDKEIRTYSLARLRQLARSVGLDTNAVTYQQCCTVGHQITGRHLSELPFFLAATRVNVFILALCQKGDAILQCDMQRCHICDNTIFVCKPGSIVHVVEGHIDMVSVIIADEKMQAKVNVSFQKMLPHYTYMDKLTVVSISSRESTYIDNMLGMCYESILANPVQLFYHECVQSQITAIAYSMLRLLTRSYIHQEKIDSAMLSNHQQEYFRQFINLLGLHFREEHKVQFYADQIHISPKYLSTVVAQLTGRSPSKWIDEYIMTEACALLRNSDLSVQEISYRLNFPNQSFFGKYFKTHSGKSPSAYRK